MNSSIEVSLTKMVDTGGAKKFRADIYYDMFWTSELAIAKLVGLDIPLTKNKACKILFAEKMIPVLEEGIKDLEEDDIKEKAKDKISKHSIGGYVSFMRFLIDFLDACKLHPNCSILIETGDEK